MPGGAGVAAVARSAAATNYNNLESLYQNWISAIHLSSCTCELMSLSPDAKTVPQLSLLLGHIFGFENIALSWADLYYCCLQFELLSEVLHVNLKASKFEYPLLPIGALSNTLPYRLRMSVNVLLKEFIEEDHAPFENLGDGAVMAMHGLSCHC